MRVCILGFTVPDQVYEEVARIDQVLPAQTHRFAWALVEALLEGGAEEVRLISVPPVSSFPANPRVLWRGGRWERGNTPGLLLAFINLPVIKHISRFMSCLVWGRAALSSWRPDWLLVHGVHSPFLWFSVLVRRRLGIRIAVVLTDPPGVVRSTDGRLTAALKKMDRVIVRVALRHFDAVIALTSGLSRDFAPTVPALVMEGVYAADAGGYHSIESSRVPPPTRPRVIYAGGIQREYGVLGLVEAVRSSSLDLELRLFGKGPDEGLVREAARSDPRVFDPRVLGASELAAWYNSATVLVQPRPVSEPFVPYSFPSKLIEYMATGVPVISTRLMSIPTDYEPYVIWSDSDDALGLSDAITRVLKWDLLARAEFGARAAQYILETKSPRAQGQRIVQFLRLCMQREEPV